VVKIKKKEEMDKREREEQNSDVPEWAWWLYQILATAVLVSGLTQAGRGVVEGYILPKVAPLVVGELALGAGMWAYFYWMNWGGGREV